MNVAWTFSGIEKAMNTIRERGQYDAMKSFGYQDRARERDGRALSSILRDGGRE
jgi:hypothetical protein